MKDRYLTEKELNQIRHQEDMLKGNINRMCVTDEPYELMSMFLTANKRLKKIHDICIKKFTDELNKEEV